MADEFFPPVPRRPFQPPHEQPEWWGPPRDGLGVAVPLDSVMLARTDDVALVLEAVRAYATGFTFTVVAVARRGREAAVGALVPAGPMGETDAEASLRVGVELADGGRAVVTPHWARKDRPAGPVIAHRGGGGDGSRYEMRYWVWPLPPRGPLVVAVRWTARGVPLTRHTMQADPIVEAAGRSRRIWDE